MRNPDPVPAAGSPDVLFEREGRIIGALWILLFAVRGLIIPPLIYYGLLPAAITDWLNAALHVNGDGSGNSLDGINAALLCVYAALLVATCIVIALRAVRGAASQSPGGRAARLG